MPFTARVERPQLHRGGSASTNGHLAAPSPSLPSSLVYIFRGQPGRSSNARVERAPSERARSASRRTTRLSPSPSLRVPPRIPCRIVDSRTDGIPLNRERPSLVLVTHYPCHTPISGGPLRLVVTAEAEDSEMERKGEERADRTGLALDL